MKPIPHAFNSTGKPLENTWNTVALSRYPCLPIMLFSKKWYPDHSFWHDRLSLGNTIWWWNFLVAFKTPASKHDLFTLSKAFRKPITQENVYTLPETTFILIEMHDQSLSCFLWAYPLLKHFPILRFSPNFLRLSIPFLFLFIVRFSINDIFNWNEILFHVCKILLDYFIISSIFFHSDICPYPQYPEWEIVIVLHFDYLYTQQAYFFI